MYKIDYFRRPTRKARKGQEEGPPRLGRICKNFSTKKFFPCVFIKEYVLLSLQIAGGFLAKCEAKTFISSILLNSCFLNVGSLKYHRKISIDAAAMRICLFVIQVSYDHRGGLASPLFLFVRI